MADRSERLAIIVTAEDLASGKLSKVKAELAGMGTAGKLSAIGLGTGIAAVRKGEAALKHFGERVTSLAGPIGLIGLTGAAFGVAGAMEEGIRKATDWGLAIEKLQGLTSNTAEQLSGLLGITEKYGISNERIAQIVGFTEKTLGKLEVAHASAGKAAQSNALKHLELRKAQLVANGESTKTINKLIAEQKARDQLNASLSDAADGTTKLAKLEHDYGVKLTDSKGKVLDFQSVLLNVADAYAKATTAADKAKVAALSASVFGRGYADLIPILKLGRKGILDAEEAAKELGLTLSQKNVEDLAKYREAMREAGDATSGLELQLGLLVMPDLTDVLKSFTTYMSTHRADVQNFFREGLHVAEGLAAFVTGTLIPAAQGVAGVFTTAWNAIPAPLRDMIVKGVIADRTIKFLFGFSPIHTIIDIGEQALSKALGGVLGGALGGIFQKGGSPANPLWVASAQGGLPGGAAAGGGLLVKAAGLVQNVLIVGMVAEVADLIHGAISPGGGLEGRTQSGQLLPTDQLQWPFGPKNTPDINLGPLEHILGGDSSFPRQASAAAASLVTASTLLDRGGRELGMASGKMKDDLHGVVDLQRGVWAEFRGDMQRLVSARKPEDIQRAAKAIADRIADKDQGSLHATLAAERAIKDQLKNVHDPKTRAALEADLRRVESKIPGREWIQRQISAADRINASTKGARQKIAELKPIEASLLKHGDTHAAAQVHQLIAIQQNTLAMRNSIGGILYQGGGRASKDDTAHPTSSKPSGGGGGSSGSPNSDHGRAVGGPIWPGKWRVGELGQEDLTIRPDGTGFVRPVGGRRLMPASLARQVMVNLQLSVNLTPRVNFSLAGHQDRQAAELRYGKLSAG